MNPLSVIEQKEAFVYGDSVNVKTLTRVYGIKQVEMSRLLKCKRQQASTMISKTRYKPRSEDNKKKLFDMVRIYSLLRLLLKKPGPDGDDQELDEKISRWFRIPNPAYPDAASPFELVSAGRGDIVIHSLMNQLHTPFA